MSGTHHDAEAVEKRVDDLLSRMSLPEKVAQMVQIPYSTVSKKEAIEWAKKGAG